MRRIQFSRDFTRPIYISHGSAAGGARSGRERPSTFGPSSSSLRRTATAMSVALANTESTVDLDVQVDSEVRSQRIGCAPRAQPQHRRPATRAPRSAGGRQLARRRRSTDRSRGEGCATMPEESADTPRLHRPDRPPPIQDRSRSPPTANAAGIDEMASERWCQALAIEGRRSHLTRRPWPSTDRALP